MPRNPDPYLMDPDEEIAVISEADKRRASYRRISAGVTPEMAQRASEMAAASPNLGLGLLQAMAQAQEVDARRAMELAQHDDGGLVDSVRDFVGDSVGTVVGAIGEGASWALENAYEYGIKPAIRGAFTAFDAASQELVQRPLTAGLAAVTGEGGFRESYNEYGDSALVNILQGDVDNDAEGGVLGTGLIPGGRAEAEAQAERTLTINGRKGDVGQAIANAMVGEFVDPGSRVYDMVAGVGGFAVEVGLDPSAWATGGLSKAYKASKLLSIDDAGRALHNAGGIAGARRNTVLVEQARNFFGNDKLIERLAQADPYEIFQSWGRSNANRIDIETINALGNTTDEGEIAGILFDSVARGDITQKGIVSGPGYAIRKSLMDSRLPASLKFFTPEGKFAGLAPKGRVSADDVGEASLKIDSLLRQTNVDRETRAQIFNKVAAVQTGREDQMFDVLTDALDEVAKKAVDPKLATLSGVVKNYRDELEAFRVYGVDSWGNEIDLPYAKKKVVQNFDGTDKEIVVPTPQILSEMNSQAMHIPDITDLRRAATKNGLLRKVYTSKGWEVTADSTRWITSTVFKPAAILRLAYIPRIGIEEQARLTAAHYTSVFNHPTDFIMANVVNRKEMADLMGNPLLREDGKGIAQLNNVVTRDAYGQVADRAATRARTFSTTSVTVDEAGNLPELAYSGWRGELGQVSADDAARKMTEFRGNTAEFKAWAQSDEGMKYMRGVANINEESKTLLEFGNDFDKWAKGLRVRVEAKTAGFDDDIVQRVLDGNIPFAGMKDDKAANATFSRFLANKVKEGKNPGVVKVAHMPEARTKAKDTLLNGLFDWITGKPTSYFARNPAFRQSIIRRSGELMDALVDDDVRREALEAVTKNLQPTKSELRGLEKSLDAAKGKQGLIGSVDELNEIVVAKSAEDVKKLLFDVTRRGAGQDALEVIFPFLDAWKEVSTTWMRLLKDNPSFFIRAQAGYRELRDQGTFYAGPFGEVFRYPGGGFLSEFVAEMNERGGGLTDIPAALGSAALDTARGETPDYSVALEGNVQGLNLIATGIGPGFGPVVQWGASYFDSPDTEILEGFMAPFGTGVVGDPEDALNVGNIATSLVPAWARKVVNAVSEGDIDERQWNSMVGDAMAALVASGEYDPSEGQRLKEDSERYANYLLLMRGAAQFAAPTGPSATLEVEAEENFEHEDWNPENDPQGRFFTLGVMREDYHRLAEAYGYDVAAQKFFDMYGMEPFFVTQAKSTSDSRELPVSSEGGRWMDANSDFVDQYPLIAGYFAPTDEDASLDFDVYNAQFERGQRKTLDQDEQYALAVRARATTMWKEVQRRTEPLPRKQREQVRQNARAKIDRIHPGWNVPVLRTVPLDNKIDELTRAVSDPRIAGNPATKPLQKYLLLREMTLGRLRAYTDSPTATLGREAAEPARAALMQIGTQIAQENPEFMGVWTGMLRSELEED